MAQESTRQSEAEHALDHLEEEINTLEGVSRWRRWLGWSAVVLVAAGVVGSITWFLVTPPAITSGGTAYVSTGGMTIEILEPRGMMLAEPPTRLAWESVSGRLQYLVRVYVKGSGDPIFERVVTNPSLELTADDRARMTGGTTYVGTVVAQARDGSTMGTGQTTFRVR